LEVGRIMDHETGLQFVVLQQSFVDEGDEIHISLPGFVENGDDMA
jgi:hypothetical protein